MSSSEIRFFYLWWRNNIHATPYARVCAHGEEIELFKVRAVYVYLDMTLGTFLPYVAQICLERAWPKNDSQQVASVSLHEYLVMPSSAENVVVKCREEQS